MTGEGLRRADIAILTMKKEELEAALEVFAEDSSIFVGPDSKRHYNLRSAPAGEGARYRVGIVRLVDQGNGEAVDAARDAISELQPALVLVVGIGGAVPGHDLTLGDVLVSLRVNDYTLHALKPDGMTEYALGGGPIGTALARSVVNLPARQSDLGDWNSELPDRPTIDLANLDLYGPGEWRDRVRESIDFHFVKHPRSKPQQIDGVLASSDALVKANEPLIQWLSTARDTRAIDMESAGVYRGARDRAPMLAIRAMSDVVGLKRDEAWVRYASIAAARFARAYLCTRPVERGRRDDPTQAATGTLGDDGRNTINVNNFGPVGQQFITHGHATIAIPGEAETRKPGTKK